MKLTITVTDDDTTTTTTGTNAVAVAQPQGADVHDGGPMPDALRHMAAEVAAGRMPPPR